MDAAFVEWTSKLVRSTHCSHQMCVQARPLAGRIAQNKEQPQLKLPYINPHISFVPPPGVISFCPVFFPLFFPLSASRTPNLLHYAIPISLRYAKADFTTLFAALTEISEMTVKAFSTGDTAIAVNVEPLEEVIDDLTKMVRDKHIERLRSGECNPELGVYLSDLLINCERVSDHCSNVTISIIQISKSAMNSHDYLSSLKAERSPQFLESYAAYGQKYRLATK